MYFLENNLMKCLRVGALGIQLFTKRARLLRFGLEQLGLLVRLLIKVEEQDKEDGRVHQQQGGDQFRVSAVKEQHLGRVEEHESELQLYEKMTDV